MRNINFCALLCRYYGRYLVIYFVDIEAFQNSSTGALYSSYISSHSARIYKYARNKYSFFFLSVDGTFFCQVLYRNREGGGLKVSFIRYIQTLCWWLPQLGNLVLLVHILIMPCIFHAVNVLGAAAAFPIDMFTRKPVVRCQDQRLSKRWPCMAP